MMKKSLFLGLVALAFVSCSKDNFSPSDVPSGGGSGSVEDTYANNFIKTFGTPAADQTWGFGKAANFAKSIRRADYVIPGEPFTYENTDGYFKYEIPGTAVSPDGLTYFELQNAKELKLVNASYSIGLDRGSRDIYVSGTVTLNVDQTHWINQARIYVLPNATLTLNMSSEYPIKNMLIYVSEDGVLNYSSAVLEKNEGEPDGGKIYNRGTVNFLADEFQANNDAVIYNDGNVTGKSIKLAPNQNNPSFFYNFGDVNLTKNLILFSNSNFLNEGNVKVKENTELTGTVQEGYVAIWWINKGHFETKNMVMHATNNKLYNLCQLFVKETLNVYEGEFNLLKNSYTEAGSAEFHMFYINMYGNAGINIKGNVNVTSKYNGTFDQGFKYKDGDDNYVMIGGKCSVNMQKGTLNIDEGITYAVKEVEILNGGSPVTEEEVKRDFESEYPVTIFNATSGVEFGKLSVTPNTTDCGATWTIGTLPETLPSLHVMAEDLSAVEASDFDFNDVVIDVFYVDANTVKIVLLAAGGTLPLIIAENDEWEVHKLFDVPVTCMVNTGKKYHVAQPPYSQVEGKAAVELTLTGKTWSKDQDEFAAQVNQQVKLHVYKDGAWFELKAEQGKPACKIATPVEIFNLDWYETEYRWPWEKQNIGGDFKNWVENPLLKWYTTRKSLE